MNLKPCPFCGGKVHLEYNSFIHGFKVYHSGNTKKECFIGEPIEIYGPLSLSEASRAWNRRAEQ